MNELEQLREDFKEHTTLDERNYIEIKTMLTTINTKLDPILDVYRSIIISKSFILGLSGVIVGITAIGAAFIWIINSAIQK